MACGAPGIISRGAPDRVLQVTLSYKFAPALFCVLHFACFLLGMGKRGKTWADGCERFLERLEDPKDRQKFRYVLDKLDMDDPWDTPPSLCSGLEQACICRLWGCLPWELLLKAVKWVAQRTPEQVMDEREAINPLHA